MYFVFPKILALWITQVSWPDSLNVGRWTPARDLSELSVGRLLLFFSEISRSSPFHRLKLVRCPRLTHSYLPSFNLLSRKPLSSIETQSLPTLLRCYPRSFTFYLGNPFPRLKLSRYPRSFAATLAALPSISEIPFLDSWVPD